MGLSSRSFRSAVTLLFLLLLVAFFAVYTTLHHHVTTTIGITDRRDTHFYRRQFLSSASNYTVAAYLRHLTLLPHLAGSPQSLSPALYVQSHFQSLGLSTHTTNFSVLLSYPKRSSLAAHLANGTVLPVTLSEPGVPQNGVVLPYHAYSISGSVIGAALFLNYGRDKDYRTLRALGVEVKGCVGLIRRGSGLSRFDVVANAAAHGVSAVLLYTESDFKEGVERGTVMDGLGDPLSPGWPAGGEKLEFSDHRLTQKFPGIPSLPISQAAAEVILGTLEGMELPSEWGPIFKTGDGRISRVGPGPTKLDFSYEGERKTATIINVFGVIKGSEEPDRAVLLGNHRDAWTYGAVDPNSGTASLLDIARRFALLRRLGWNPRRTIVLCSWDAEEFGMIGSTEWVEQNVVNLGAKAVAYFNVDCAVQGQGFFVSANPQLDDLIFEVTKQVKDPDLDTMSLYESWMASNKGVNLVERLGRADSDFAPFLFHAGIPSIDLYFGSDFPVYHTAFDTYEWMVNYGDPLFHRHATVAAVWGLAAIYLADELILPFNHLSYAKELKVYMSALKPLLEGTLISLDPIAAAIEEFTDAALRCAEEIKTLKAGRRLDAVSILSQRALNDRIMLSERGFLDMEGLPQGQWFRHLIYGPLPSKGARSIEFFPGVSGAMAENEGAEEEEKGNMKKIQHEIWRVARAIERSASVLRGEFT